MKNQQVKKEFIAYLQEAEAMGIVPNWDEVVKRFDVKYNEVFTKNRKYTIVHEDNSKECSTYTISNGNAWDCPALHRGACNVPCYGLKGCYRWNDAKVNKEFQRLVLKFASLEWLFDAIKHLATNTRCKDGNRLRTLRLNEVSDLNQVMLDKMVELAKMLTLDTATEHIQVFTYTKQGILDFSEVAKLPNFCVNTSQTVNAVYDGGNVYIAVTQEYFDAIVETDIVKKCNCAISCNDCGLCYKDGGYIIFCLIH